MLRAIHHFGPASGPAVDGYRSGLPADVAATVFTAAGGCAAVAETWPTEAAFARHSLDAFATGQPFWLDLVKPSEIYRVARFTRTDGVWHPVDRPVHQVVWGNSRPVRILYEFSAPAGLDFHDDTQTRETLREPGCEQFEYFVAADDPSRYLLLELWADQLRYDQHWDLRLRTGTSATATPDPGDIVEFYRYAEFDCRYGSWWPTADGPDFIPSTVRWPG